MTARNILMAASGAPTDANYIEDVFSTWLYTGTGAIQSINNGMDLTKPGYLIWAKSRSDTGDNRLQWAANNFLNNTGLSTNLTSAAGLTTNIIQLNSNGYALGGTTPMNTSGTTYASWTFRKQPKFFDVVTYTGNGDSVNFIAHNLQSTPGALIIKATSTTGDWFAWCRTSTSGSYLKLNSSAAQVSTGNPVTSSNFFVSTSIAGMDTNQSGVTYVAYLFAHDAGGFGLTGTDNVISCGSYTGNGSATGPLINLGYEPQWLMVKNATGTGPWIMVDNMRGFSVNTSRDLIANSTTSEYPHSYLGLNATGFQPISTDASVNTSGSTYIYIAIRRGPMKVPTVGTSVFVPVAQTTAAPTTVTTNFPVDLVLFRNSRTNSFANTSVFDRLRGRPNYLYTSGTDQEGASSAGFFFDSNTTIREDFSGAGSPAIFWNFRRAPGFFDEVCYTGNGDNSRTLTSNLGGPPELCIVKARSATSDWNVSRGSASGGVFTQSYYTTLRLNTTAAQGTVNTAFNFTGPPYTSSFGVPLAFNTNGVTYVAYLFASCPGVSKVGSYTGNGSSQTINCDFTAGARFIMIKRTDSTGNWYVWDTARGIVTANDPWLILNASVTAEVTTDDSVDPASSGFIVNQLSATNINVNAANYIFLAIA
jgi:hypothetical protein